MSSPIIFGPTGAKSLTPTVNANNFVDGYASTATAAGTTTLTVSSSQQQYFTGTTTQTVALPVVSTLVLGQSFTIVNLSTGNVTVQSSGGNTVATLSSQTQVVVTCISLSGTDASSWSSLVSVISSNGPITANIPNVQSLSSYTPTVSTGAFTFSNLVATRIGDGLDLSFTALNTSVGSGLYEFSLPSGLSFDSSVALSAVSNGVPAGNTPLGTIIGTCSFGAANSSTTYNQIGGSGLVVATSSNTFACIVLSVIDTAWSTSSAQYTNKAAGFGSASPAGSVGNSITVKISGAKISGWTANSTYALGMGYAAGPQVTANIPNATDPVAYTPTTQGLGTVSNVSFTSQRIGANLLVTGKLTVGTTTASQIQIGLGYNGTAGNVTIAGSGTFIVGQVDSSQPSTTTTTILGTGGNSYLQIGIQDASGNGVTPKNGNDAYSPGITLSFTATVPISGWTANSTYTLGNGNVYKAPTVQTFTSGSGTYTTPTGPSPLYIRVRMVGGGGGGGGSGDGGVATIGGDGDATIFGTSLLTANGGPGGNIGPVSGGSATVNTSSTVFQIVAISGSDGGGNQSSTTVGTNITGGYGGCSPFGGAGASGTAQPGGDGAANSGSGGGGGGITGSVSNAVTGVAGASGGYLEAMITSPLSSYSYAVGAGGAAGIPGTSGLAGGAGGSGIIIVEEFYQ